MYESKLSVFVALKKANCFCLYSDSSNGSGDAWLNRHLRPESSVRSAAVWVWTSSTRVRVLLCHHNTRQPGPEQSLHKPQQVGTSQSKALPVRKQEELEWRTVLLKTFLSDLLVVLSVVPSAVQPANIRIVHVRKFMLTQNAVEWQIFVFDSRTVLWSKVFLDFVVLFIDSHFANASGHLLSVPMQYHAAYYLLDLLFFLFCCSCCLNGKRAITLNRTWMCIIY